MQPKCSIFVLLIILTSFVGCNLSTENAIAYEKEFFINSISVIPKSNKILFCITYFSKEFVTMDKIGIINIDGTGLNWINTGSNKSFIDGGVSNNGENIAVIVSVVENGGYYIDSLQIIKADSLNSYVIFRTDEKSGWIIKTSWSPQDDKLAVIKAREQKKGDISFVNYDLYFMNIEEKVIEKLDENVALFTIPKWDSDGRWIYYEKISDTEQNLVTELWRVKYDGLEKQLLFGRMIRGGYVIDHMKKKIILTEYTKDSNSKLWILNLDNAEKLPLITRRNFYIGAISEGGNVLLCIHCKKFSWKLRGELWLYNILTAEERQLTFKMTDSTPIWSEDSNIIIFIRNSREIWTLDANNLILSKIYP